MGYADIDTSQDHGTKKKTPTQLQSLEKLYSEEKYPKAKEMEVYAVELKLTYKQIRGWFSERRRRERRKHIPSAGAKKKSASRERERHKYNEELAICIAVNGNKDAPKATNFGLQALHSKDYILKRVFRKDGPPLGLEFDPVPENVFRKHSVSFDLALPCQDYPRIPWVREVLEQPLLDSRRLCVVDICPPKNHGIGKRLMTLCQGASSNSRKLPSSLDISSGLRLFRSDASPGSLFRPASRNLSQMLIPAKKSPQKRSKKRKFSTGKKVPCSKAVDQKELLHSACKLFSARQSSSENMDEQGLPLIDDEELELRELQVGPNPLRCSGHLASSCRHSCPLCKDLLTKFPPKTVKMKQPLCTRPWDSTLLVKKLFKVFQFLYQYAAAIEVCSFTLDEFSLSFHEKDPFLLGKIHVALLKLLLLDVEVESMSGFTPRVSKDGRFLGLLQFVREQNFDVKFLSQSLNSLTWPEIFRQVMIAAGFGLRHNALRREIFNKERKQMAKYGLHPLTLKGELFCILSGKGSGGSRVSELAKASPIVTLDEYSTSDEIEEAIYMILSSDVTLFEKIGPSVYRLRIDPQIKGKDVEQSQYEDLGSVDDDAGNSSTSSSSDESECSDSENLIVRYKEQNIKKCLKLTGDSSIDESYGGEAWMLGLMEGEYFDLSIEEKLDALIALVDLVAYCSSCQMEIPERRVLPTNVCVNRSGGKIKKLSSYKPMSESYMESPLLDYSRNGRNLKSSKRGQSLISLDGKIKIRGEQKCSSVPEENEQNAHPMQSIYLGCDRRYNNYWLFLGPCNVSDPGHRRVYFESSEDGHWEVIDTSQDLRFLLSVLDCRGRREAHLSSSLENGEVFLCEAMDGYNVAHKCCRQTRGLEMSVLDNNSGDSSSPISDVDNISSSSDSLNPHLNVAGVVIHEVGKKFEEKKQKWAQIQAFDRWIWSDFYSNLNAVKYSTRSYMESLARCDTCHDLYWRDEKHCRICHLTFELDFDLEERYAVHVATCKEIDNGNVFPSHKVLPSQLQALKAGIHVIEASIPEAALVVSWRRLGHKLWIKRLRRTSSLPELLQALGDFVTAINLDWLSECSPSSTAFDEAILHFQTIPQTIPAVALWIVKLDALIGQHSKNLHCGRTSEGTQGKRRRICTR